MIEYYFIMVCLAFGVSALTVAAFPIARYGHIAELIIVLVLIIIGSGFFGAALNVCGHTHITLSTSQ